MKDAQQQKTTKLWWEKQATAVSVAPDDEWGQKSAENSSCMKTATEQ